MQKPKGTFDLLPYGTEEPWQQIHLWQRLEDAIRTIAKEYCYEEIRTPIYENTSLFDRGVGETSDIVTKEMFTFIDKGERSNTLRPEGTSSVMRAFIENNLNQLGNVHKFFYIGPMFRYERPQSGRYRQHHQFGIEAIGNELPEQDGEVIDLLYQFYQRLGLKNLQVHINSVGDTESRKNYKAALLRYLQPYVAELSEESKTRFEKNPLRILDSKSPKDKEIMKGAPSILDYLTDDAAKHFASVQTSLQRINIPFTVNPHIVRGLDYYNKTVFEVLTSHLGAQNTIGAGGRFDGLLSTLGGPDLPAVGFATGLERVLQTMIAQGVPLPSSSGPLIYFIPLGPEAREKCFSLVTQCRHKHIAADIDLHAKKMQQALQMAVKKGATYCAIIGTEELQSGNVPLKTLQTREQKIVPLENLINILETLSHV